MPRVGRRNPWLDWLRLFCICAAVWLHIGGWGTRYTEFRMPLITLITAYVSTFTRDRRRTCIGLVASLAFWGTLQSLFWARYLIHNSPEFRWRELGEMVYSEFFQGPLWYLPFAALVVLATPGLSRLPGWAAMALALAALAASRPLIDALPMPFRQWALVAPTIPLGWVAARGQYRYLVGFLVGSLLLPGGARCGIAAALFAAALVAPTRYVPAAPERLGRLLYMGQGVGIWVIYYVVRRDDLLTPPFKFALLIPWAAALAFLDSRRMALPRRGRIGRPWRAPANSFKMGGVDPGRLESI